jgi:hypothetical protein
MNIGAGSSRDGGVMSEKISARELDISEREVEVLGQGLLHYGGPAHATEEFANAMGFSSANSMLEECMEIRRKLQGSGALSARDWTRALLALEICFASKLMGAGYQWSTVTGLSDNETILVLRSIQRKLIRLAVSVVRGGGLVSNE